jgi:hypothetical protein
MVLFVIVVVVLCGLKVIGRIDKREYGWTRLNRAIKRLSH